MCALAPLVIAAALAGPMCMRADGDRMPEVLQALIGDARVELTASDPQFEAAIRAIHVPAAKPKRRGRR
ncbi:MULTISPECIES: hypothetical protein [unclassified Methylobacterium]|uniref:hypothetical protein n=1 Tax=unclassified Methylobacterium TaxID=2615210 RepID=UPI0011C1D66E|nr:MULTISPECIES: hypothetical protein [unclassified Methylobacterium]QEE39829.1 hypothetical protein FVA80_13570 [Methylobacterium sp. WL1]TXN57327.1 hypothetical protein FV241_11740 [Methylobacterium sp. WL2]